MAYKYEHVRVLEILDGDTVRLQIDLGNRCLWQESFRLYGIDTPEIHGQTKDSGLAAQARLGELLANGVLAAETLKPDKYGRTLVKLTIVYKGWPEDVATRLIDEGLGVPYFGGKK